MGLEITDPIEQPSPPREPPLNADEVSQLLRRFVDASDRSAEATVDDLVRARVGAAMNVLAVEILDPALDPAMKERLETAIVGAVNTALRRIALAAGRELRDLVEQQKADKPSPRGP
jgi:DNA-binding protein YbaB